MDGFDQNQILSLWLSYGAEHFPKRFDSVAARFIDLAEAFEAAKRRSAAPFAFLPERAKHRLLEAAADGFMERYTDWLIQNDVGILLRSSAEYPALLREIPDAPALLFYKGRIEAEPVLPLAMVGARRSTRYGRDVAHLFGEELAAAGATVVSGLAAGIDAAAASGALSAKDAEYPTLAVLGTGIDTVYPKENAALYSQIIERGAILTEFLPKTPPLRENFPIRNRIVSGMSRGVVVIEAGERSGTSITANFALDQGRDVFAVPGRITDLMSVGTNRLIQQGAAKPVFCVNDILSEYHLDGMVSLAQSSASRIRLSSLTKQEQAVAEVLKTGEKTVDELLERLPMTPGELNSCLTAMEFSGIMKQLPGRLYELDALRIDPEED